MIILAALLRLGSWPRSGVTAATVLSKGRGKPGPTGLVAGAPWSRPRWRSRAGRTRNSRAATSSGASSPSTPSRNPGRRMASAPRGVATSTASARASGRWACSATRARAACEYGPSTRRSASSRRTSPRTASARAGTGRRRGAAVGGGVAAPPRVPRGQFRGAGATTSPSKRRRRRLDAAGDRVAERNRDFDVICKRTWFSSAPPRVLDHDAVFWLGDLNYRIRADISTAEVFARAEAGDLAFLRAHDQLNVERAAGRVFRGFDEGPLTFPVTYVSGADNFADESRRRRGPRRRSKTSREAAAAGDVDIPRSRDAAAGDADRRRASRRRGRGRG